MTKRLQLFLASGAALLWSAVALADAPSHLHSDGIPPIPAELTAGTAPYQDIRSATFMDWHPQRREMLVGTRFGDVRQIHQVGMPSGDRQQLTFGREPAFGAAWNPDAKRNSFVYQSDQGGAEFYQIYLYDAGRHETRLLTDGHSRNEAPVWSRDGRSLAFNSTARNGKDTDIYEVSADGGAPRMIYQADGNWEPFDWSPDGRHLLMGHFVSIRQESLWNLDVATGKAEPAGDGQGDVVNTAAHWDGSGRGYYYISDAGTEFRHLAYRSGGQSSVLTHLPWDVDAYDVTRNGLDLAFDSNEDGLSRVHLLERTTPTAPWKEIPGPQLGSCVVAGLHFHPQRLELGLSISNAQQSSDAYSYRLVDHKLIRWTHSETGGLDASRFVPPTLVHFPSFDQRSIPAFVYRPVADRFKPPYPVLIDIHGGPESQYRPGFLGRANYLVNQLGVALVYPNVRGSSGYGKTYVDLDNGKLRADSVKDIGALLDWIGRQPDLDSQRVAVQGGSYGGFMSLASLVAYSDRLKCGIDYVGISNFVTFLRNTQDYRKDLRRVEYGDERDPSMLAFLQEVSPLTHADRIRKPLFVAQGANDPRVPKTEAEQIVAAVRANQQPVWYLLADDEGHGFQKRANQDYFQDAQVMFWQTYLLK